MFALDLFNNDYERRLAEGAVDQLEQRRIDDLAMKMDDLVARAKQVKDPEHKSALVKEFQKVKAERDSYFKIKDECMGYGGLGEENVNEGAMKDMLWDMCERMERDEFINHCVSEWGWDPVEMGEFWDSINGPLDEAGIGHDIANKTEKIARATPGTPAGKVASTVKNAAKWLAGKGGPGKEGPTYEGKDDAWQTETPWKETPKAKSGKPVDPRGEVTHLSDVARREAVLKAQAQKKNPNKLDEGQRLHAGDPVVVIGPNEFEGKTGEIYEFSPSGLFVIVDLYNHGKHSMHLSDVEYNQYADTQDEEDDWYDEMDEGFQDFNKVEPYEVCLAGKPVKRFDYYEQARKFHDNWKQKLYREGNKEKADKITLNPILDEEEQKPAGWGEFPPKQEITIVPPKKLKSGETYQDQNKYWQSQGQAPIYKTNEAGSPAQQAAIAIAMKKSGKKPKQVDELDANTLKSYADKRGAQVAAMKADNPDAPAGSPEWIKAAVPGIQVARAKQKIARKERQAGVTEDTGSWIVYDPETQQIKKRFKTHTAGKSYARTHNLGFASSSYYFDNIKEKEVAEIAPPGAKAERMVKHIKKAYSKDGKLTPKEKAIAYATTWKAHNDGKVEEAQTDYQKRRARERDVDAGRPVKPLPKNPQTDYARKRAKEKRDMELGEDLDNSGVERAILNRIMVAHTDLLRQFGPQKVMQAAEEVAYNVGDVDEIGTSDVSAYVNQVRQILGAEA